MKKILILTLVCCMATISAWAESSVVKIHQKSGGIVSYAVADKPVVTMNNNYVVMTTTKTTIEYPMDQLDKLTFEKDAAPEPSQYNNVAYIEDITVHPYAETYLSVQLTNSEDAYGFEFRIKLPEGIHTTPSRAHSGDIVIELGDRVNADDHVMRAHDADGEIVVLCYSPTHKAISGNSGEVARIPVYVSADIAPGKHPLVATDGAVSLANSTPEFDAVQTTLTVGDPLQNGDANGDGKINVGDITAVVAYMLDIDQGSFYLGFADANDDGSVDVGDIAEIISHIFSPRKAAQMRKANANSHATAEYSFGQLERNSMGNLRLPILANNSDDAFFAFQFDITLPEGLQATGITLNTDRVNSATIAQSATLDNGNLRVVAYNLTADNVKGNSGAIAYVDLTGEMDGETGEVALTEGVFSNIGKTIYANDVRATIDINDANAISNIRMENNNIQVFNAQGVLIHSAKATDNLHADELLQNMPQGTYIIKNGATTFKVTKK